MLHRGARARQVLDLARVLAPLVALILAISETTSWASAPNVPVVPINRAAVIAGETIPVGYRVGHSLIYPGRGGFSILADPSINWTQDAMLSYVKNHEAEQDLAVFLRSPYAHSAQAKEASQPLPVVPTSTAAESIAPQSSSYMCNYNATTGLCSYPFNAGTFFAVNGYQNGVIADHSVLTGHYGGGTLYSGLDYPYSYIAWTPDTAVYDGNLSDNVTSVKLTLTWTFSGIGVSVGWPPNASIFQNSSGYTWDSGLQPTWYYEFYTTSPIIWSNSLLATQTGTSYVATGVVNIKQANGSIYGYSGTHSEGFNSGGIWGDAWQ